MSDPGSFVTQLYDRVREYSNLSIENFKLLVTERLTLLLSMIALAVVLFGLVLSLLFFATMCVAHLLADVMPLAWAYAVMAGFNLLLCVLAVVFKRPLIVDPLAKFISRIILS